MVLASPGGGEEIATGKVDFLHSHFYPGTRIFLNPLYGADSYPRLW